MTSDINEQLVLISGESATGKSASLMNLTEQEKWMYLNCEAGKRLPFKNQFKAFTITDPYQVIEAFQHAKDNPNYKGIIIDTSTFLMDMFESQYVLGTGDTMKGWSNYQQFFKSLLQQHIAGSDKAVIVLAHTKSVFNEKLGDFITAVPIKGALANNGVESYFSTVVSTKKIGLKELENYQNGLLHITDRDRAVGYKHVFQTNITKTTINEKIRSPMGMFADNETYIDNDAQQLLLRLKEYYG